MVIVKIVKLVLTLCLVSTVHAENYVEITDTGEAYSNKYYTINDGKKDVPKEIRGELNSRTNEFYHVAKGHVGKLVYTIKKNDQAISIIDVLGNYVLHSQDGCKPATEEDFKVFRREVQPLHSFFGYDVGVDSYLDVIENLKQSNIRFEKRWFIGSSKRPVLYVYDDPRAPVINGVRVKTHKMQFIDDRLYSIEFWWEPESNKLSDKNNFTSAKIYDGLIDGLKTKYLKDKSIENKFAIATDSIGYGTDIGHNFNHFWLNNSQHITVQRWHNYPNIKLTYNSTRWFKKAREINKELNTQAKKDEEEAKAKKNASSL